MPTLISSLTVPFLHLSPSDNNTPTRRPHSSFPSITDSLPMQYHRGHSLLKLCWVPIQSRLILQLFTERKLRLLSVIHNNLSKIRRLKHHNDRWQRSNSRLPRSRRIRRRNHHPRKSLKERHAFMHQSSRYFSLQHSQEPRLLILSWIEYRITCRMLILLFDWKY